MISIYDVDDVFLGGNMRMMAQIMKQRGWRVEVPYPGSYNMLITREDGSTISSFGACPPTTSYAAGYITDDKYATYRYLQSIGVNQLETIRIHELTDDAREFAARHNKFVVKPVDGSHGQGVYVNVTTNNIEEVIKKSATFSSSGTVLLQEQFQHVPSKDIRVTVLNGSVIGALERIPASVTGDGEHTVTELIKIENATIRGVPYVDKLARIDTDSACQYLGEKMNQVPKKMEHFQVVGIGNYGAGGALKDVTDTMPAWMYEQALAVSKQLGIVSAGIDYMVAPTTDKYTHDNISDVALIEINKNPALFMHDIVDGSDRVIRKYIDYLETLDA